MGVAQIEVLKSRPSLGKKKEDCSLKLNSSKMARGVAQLMKWLRIKCKSLSSNPNITKKF
jgi:hypothetical protein